MNIKKRLKEIEKLLLLSKCPNVVIFDSIEEYENNSTEIQLNDNDFVIIRLENKKIELCASFFDII